MFRIRCASFLFVMSTKWISDPYFVFDVAFDDFLTSAFEPVALCSRTFTGDDTLVLAFEMFDVGRVFSTLPPWTGCGWLTVWGGLKKDGAGPLPKANGLEQGGPPGPPTVKGSMKDEAGSCSIDIGLKQGRSPGKLTAKGLMKKPSGNETDISLSITGSQRRASPSGLVSNEVSPIPKSSSKLTFCQSLSNKAYASTSSNVDTDTWLVSK